MKRIITLALTCLMLVAIAGLTACGAPSNSSIASAEFNYARGGYEVEELEPVQKEPGVSTGVTGTVQQESRVTAEILGAAQQEYEADRKVLDAAAQKYELAKQELELAERRYENGELSREEFFATMEEFFDGPHREYFDAQEEFFAGPHREYFDLQAEYFGR